MRDWAQWALDTAVVRGASYADVRVLDLRNCALSTKKGKLAPSSGDFPRVNVLIKLSSRAQPACGRQARDLLLMGEKRYYIYILASRSRNLYTGITNNLERRVYQHKQALVPGFTRKYKIHRLVYFEVFGDVRTAIAREKQIKAWRREKKVALVKSSNPTWEDLAADWYDIP